MIVASLFALAAVLVAAGVGVTLFIARNVPLEVLDQAQRHGRFAHLAQQDLRPGSARPSRVAPVAGTAGLRTA